jgi:hypothetical protein
LVVPGALVHVKYPLASLGKSVESGGGEAIPALTAPSLQKLPLLVLTHPTNPNPYTFPTPLTPLFITKKLSNDFSHRVSINKFNY